MSNLQTERIEFRNILGKSCARKKEVIFTNIVSYIFTFLLPPLYLVSHQTHITNSCLLRGHYNTQLWPTTTPHHGENKP